MTRRAAVTSASLVLEHVPDLVRYGSKPAREPQQLEAITGGAPPVRGRRRLSAEPGVHRQPRARRPLGATARPGGATRSQAATSAGRVRRRDGPARTSTSCWPRSTSSTSCAWAPSPSRASSRCRRGDEVVGAFAPATTTSDESLTAHVLLENLSMQGQRGARPAPSARVRRRRPRVDHVRDRVRRGGRGRSVPARRRQPREGDRRGTAGSTDASGVDVKAFCAAPGPRADRGRRAGRGGRLRAGRRRRGRLGRQARHEVPGRARDGVPDPRGRARGRWPCCVGPADGSTVRSMRMDAVGRHRVAPGSSQQALLEDIVGAPLDAMGRRSATSTGTRPSSTTRRSPSRRAAATSPTATTGCSQGSASCAASSSATDIAGVRRAHGLPGFSPTQGHIASAVPWLPHALARVRAGELHRRC